MNVTKMPMKDLRVAYEAYKLYLDMTDVRDIITDMRITGDPYSREWRPDVFYDDMYNNPDFIREIAQEYDDEYTWLEPAYEQMEDVVGRKLAKAYPAWEEANADC